MSSPIYYPTPAALLESFITILSKGARPSRISAHDGRLMAFTYKKTRHMAWKHACLSDEFEPDELPKRLAAIAGRLDLSMDRPARRVGDIASALLVRALAGACYQHKGVKDPLAKRGMERISLDAGYSHRAELYQRHTTRMDLTHIDLKAAFLTPR
jgi:hypothetical protein